MYSFSFSKNQLRKVHYLARLFLLLAVFVLLPLQQTLAAPAQTAQTVSGTIFLDLDADGTFDTNEPGVGGIDIDAYDTDNNLVSGAGSIPSDTSAADGTYSIATDDTQIARIEFTNIPSHLFPGPVGADNQSSVVFLDSNTATTVNFGLMDPSRHCSTAPNIVTPCYINGNPHGTGDSATGDVMVMFPYGASGAGGGANTYLADNSEIGSTYGLAYQRTTGILFASAVMKRHSGFGIVSAGAGIPTTGGIYAIDPAAGTAVPFVDLNGLGGVTTGTDPHCYTDTGTLLGTDCLDSDSNNPTRDLNAVGGTDDALDAVGKISFGDMDISADDRTLWLVNTNESDRALIEIFIDIDALGNPVAPTAADITEHPIPSFCSFGEERPWAVSVFQDRVFVGVVCDSTGDLTAPFPGLQAFVLAHTPGGGTGNFVGVDLNGIFAGNQIDLDTSAYPRSFVSQEGGFGCGFRCITADWQPWADSWDDLYQNGLGNTDPASSDTTTTPFSHVDLAQPMLTDIEFLDDGTMIIGLRDRGGDQTGNANFSPDGTNFPGLFEGISAGDLLCLSPDDPTSPTAWTLESNGTCGTETSVGASAAGEAQGPGGAEYFWQEMYTLSGLPDSGIHHELTQGGLTYLPGTTEIVTTAFDPVTDFRAGGVLWFSTEDDLTTGGTNEAGARLRGYEVFGQDAGGTPTTFGKSNGLGDLELICPPAPVEIGNRVWIDADNDGIQDGTVVAGAGTWAEPGINGVTVELYLDDGATPGSFDATDTFVTSTATAGATPETAGQYYFTNLTVYTDYLVVIDMTQVAITGPGYSLTTPNAGAKDTIDSDATLETVAATDYAVIFVDNRKGNADPSDDTGGPGDNNHTYDAGFNTTATANLGDLVWIDDNTNNDLQDVPPEIGLDGVTVNLYTDDGGTPNVLDATDTLVGTQVTAGGGLYLFTNLPADTYFVEFIEPPNFDFVNPNVGGDDTIDSDARDPNFAADGLVTEPIVFNALADDLTWDAGLIQEQVLANLGDLVWIDDNTNNDLQDVPPEVGLDGVTVNLYTDDGGTPNVLDATDTLVGTQVTAGGGLYLFTNLPADTYFVEFIRPAGYTFVNPNVGGDDTIDSDARDANTGGTGLVTEPIVFNALADDLTWDAGLIVQTANLGDLVWIDDNTNPTDDLQQVPPEVGLDGVTVNLYTDDGGTPNVLDATDTLVGTEVTAGGGLYLFTNLPSDTYFVEFIRPAGYTFVNPNVGGDDTIDSDARDANLAADGLVTEPITFDASLGDDLTWDAGLITAANLGDLVWIDDNPNPTNDIQNLPPEVGLDGVTVNLYTDDGGTPNVLDATDTLVGTEVTAGGGLYLFTNLPSDTYFVEFIRPVGFTFVNPNVGGDDTIDSDARDANLAADGLVTEPITFDASLGDDLTWDAGLIAAANLGDLVWIDDNPNNDLQNLPPEAGLDGVTVNLYTDDGGTPNVLDATDTLVGTEVTAGGGLYLFTNLPSDTYFVEFIRPVGFTFVNPNVGGDDTIDSDARDANTGGTGLVTEPINFDASLGDDLTWDAGLFAVVANLGDLVWIDDLPNNDLQNLPPEAGLDGVTVNLYTDDGGTPNLLDATDTLVGTQVTAGGGLYLFTNLPSGDYFVEFIEPAGYDFVNPNVGGDDTIDSDARDVNLGATGLVTELISFDASLGDDLTWDAGLIDEDLANLGDLVWIDDNPNPTDDLQQVPPEVGLDGVTVNLYRDNGTTPNVLDAGDSLYGTQVTAGGGLYLFTNLPSRTYFVEFETPAGYTFVNPNVGGDDTVDSDATNPTATGLVTLLITFDASLGDDLTWDAGVITGTPASLGDFVWDDLNADGIQDPGEDGINGIVTELYTGCGAGTPACTTFVTSMLTTNNPVGGAPGWYRFDNLTPGVQYQVQWTLPIGTIFSPQDTPPDDALDSDADQAVGPNLGRSQVVSMAPGEHNPTIDAGLDPNKVGDFVWADLNKDGIQDPGEPPVSGVPVRLIRDTNGNLIYDPGVDTSVASMSTDSAGRYLFTPNDPTANFFVVFDPPAGTPITALNTGGVAVDSDVNPLCNCTIVLTVPAGVTDLTWDMGLILDLDEEGNLVLPETGFAPSVVTELPAQPEEKEYQDLGDLWLEIPSLDIEMPIVGVPFDFEEGWDVTWLDDAAGYLDGTAYPTQIGNTAITAHVTDAFGNDGPFAHLEELGFGDVFYIHAFGRKYTYEVVNNQVVSPTYTAVLDSDAFDRVTLLTCKGFNEDTDTYRYRVAVEAVLTSFGPDVPD